MLVFEKKISMVGAFTPAGVYGHNGGIPWSFAEDFKHFKQVTGYGSNPTDTTLIMGKGTRDSMPTVKNRELIVVTSDEHYVAENSRSVLSVREAIDEARYPNVVLIGGARVWSEGLLVADEIWITIVGVELPAGEYSVWPPVTTLWRNPYFRLTSAEMFVGQPDRQVEGRKAALTFQHWVRC